MSTLTRIIVYVYTVRFYLQIWRKNTNDNKSNERNHLIPKDFCTMHTTNRNHYLSTIEYNFEWYTVGGSRHKTEEAKR